MEKAFTLNQADRALEASKAFTAEVATTAAQAISNVDGAKQNKIVSHSAMLSTTGWKTDSNEYPKYYDIVDSSVSESDRADVTILASESVAKGCQFDCKTTTGAGYIRIRAKVAPTQVLSAEYQII